MGLKINQKGTEHSQSHLTRAALVLESVFIFALGFFVGLLMAPDLDFKMSQTLFKSWLYKDPRYLKYVLLLLAAFVIFHHYFCWMWLVRISNQVFSKKNWGEIYFIYTCVGLFLFSICFGILQIFWA
jgi:hypothetical protein